MALSAITVLFLVFFNTFAGVRDVDRRIYRRYAPHRRRALADRTSRGGAERAGLVFVGLKVSVPYALIGAVVGEIIASNRGLGYLVQRPPRNSISTGVFTALFVLMIIATALNEALSRLQRRLMRWRPSAIS